MYTIILWFQAFTFSILKIHKYINLMLLCNQQWNLIKKNIYMFLDRRKKYRPFFLAFYNYDQEFQDMKLFH